ncbi:MAG: hypothetical protein ACXVPN_10325 [Bacteroidia bacterium]
MNRILILLMLYAPFAFSQKAGKDLSEVYNSYLSPNLSMDFSVTVFETKNDQKGKLVGNGVIRKSNNNYYAKYQDITNVLNADGSITIDGRQKSIIFIPEKKYDLKGEKLDMFTMDSLLMYSESDSIAFKGEEDGLKHYRIVENESPVLYTDIYIDKATKHVNKIIYVYNDHTTEANYGIYKMIIDYKYFSTAPIPAGKYFGTANYLIKKNGTWSASGNLSNYLVKVVTAKS